MTILKYPRVNGGILYAIVQTMDKIESRWIKLPEVKIEQRIMTVNGRIVNLADVSTEMFSDYIEIAKPLLDKELQIARNMRRHQPSLSVQPSILVGRLALIKDESEIFVENAKGIMNTEELEKESLEKPYQSYWSVIDRAFYTPEIHRRILSGNVGVAGTWLGLTRP